MARFKGRDFQSIRSEIIDFVKEKSPQNWDFSNAADPMIRLIESIALVADHLHYYIDEMRREADLSTAKLASSIYSYALREGYSILLPRSTHAKVKLHTAEGSINNLVVPKFTKFTAQNFDMNFYSMENRTYATLESSYDSSSDSTELELVAGILKEVNFTYNDIDMYSRYELPDTKIDCSLVELIATYNNTDIEFVLVEDVMSELSQANSFSLEPSFVTGIERLFITFPFNYQNLFPVGTTFKLRYILSSDYSKPDTELVTDIDDNVLAEITSFGGYRSWELPESIRINYKKYVRDFTSLVTKNDYKMFVSFCINARCEVYDISDFYNGVFNKIPARTIFILSDLDYKSRQSLREDILNRSSRSDNILMIPYGKELYRIFVVVEIDPINVSEEDIKDMIITDLSNHYMDITNLELPVESVIYHRIHSLSKNITRAWVTLISEHDLQGINNFPNDDILNDPDRDTKYLNKNPLLKFFYDLLPNISDDGMKDSSYLSRLSELEIAKTEAISDSGLTETLSSLSKYHYGVSTGITEQGYVDYPSESKSYTYQYPTSLPYTEDSSILDIKDIVVDGSPKYYDKEEIDLYPINDEKYAKTHFIVPSLYDVIVWVYKK